MDGLIIPPRSRPRKLRRSYPRSYPRFSPLAPECPQCRPIQLRFAPTLRLVYCPTCEYACRLTPQEAAEYSDMLRGLPSDARPDLFLAAVLAARAPHAELLGIPEEAG